MAFDADPFAGLSEKTASICRYLAMGWRVSEIRNEFGYTQAMVSGIKRRHAERISRQQEELSRDVADLRKLAGCI